MFYLVLTTMITGGGFWMASEYIHCDECDEDAWWFGRWGALCNDCHEDLMSTEDGAWHSAEFLGGMER